MYSLVSPADNLRSASLTQATLDLKGGVNCFADYRGVDVRNILKTFQRILISTHPVPNPVKLNKSSPSLQNQQYTFGLISMVINNLKAACGFKVCNFFSSVTSH